MSRKEMIKLLQAIREGKVSIESLQPPQVYIFEQNDLNPSLYEMNGKMYTVQEYKEFCSSLDSKNPNSMVWNEFKTYLGSDTIITITKQEGNDPIEDDDSIKLTLNL